MRGGDMRVKQISVGPTHVHQLSRYSGIKAIIFLLAYHVNSD